LDEKKISIFNGIVRIEKKNVHKKESPKVDINEKLSDSIPKTQNIIQASLENEVKCKIRKSKDLFGSDSDEDCVQSKQNFYENKATCMFV